jgi:hypothetical protein
VQAPDFNKRHQEVVPASWKLPVEGRPRLEEVQKQMQSLDEDDSICMVCFDGASPEDNQIVFCDGCQVAVHQACYGLRDVPEGDFFCERCAALHEDPALNTHLNVVCALCPELHGWVSSQGFDRMGREGDERLVVSASTRGFKRTSDGRWVHLACALLCPGARFGSMATMGHLDLSAASVVPGELSTLAPTLTLPGLLPADSVLPLPRGLPAPQVESNAQAQAQAQGHGELPPT